jgi:NAD(P)-dependent dehydrogenase (short-subunit alcohol dehydrogenase family)
MLLDCGSWRRGTSRAGTLHLVSLLVPIFKQLLIGRRQVDVRDHAQIESMVAAAVSKWNRVDILINNAGALWWKSVGTTNTRNKNNNNDKEWMDGLWIKPVSIFFFYLTWLQRRRPSSDMI